MDEPVDILNSISSVEKTAQEIEDELFGLLDGSSPMKFSEEDDDVQINTTPGAKFTVTTTSFDDNQDFLDWLDDTPSKLPTTQTVVEESEEDLNVSLDLNLKQTIDNFFDEVFGGDTLPIPTLPTGPVALQVDTSVYEGSIEKIILAPEPAVEELRQLLIDGGFVPASFRAKVWLVLLTGRLKEDKESLNFNPSKKDLSAQPLLLADSNFLVDDSPYKGDFINPERTRKDMQEIVLHYCTRKNKPYCPIFSQVLAPIMATAHAAPRPMASACLHSLLGNFLPFVSLQTRPMQLGTTVVHSWLRLALTYHCPKLVQHLDRVLPGWELPAKTANSSQAAKMTSLIRGSTELDELERELGLDTLDETANAETPVSPIEGGSVKEGVIESAPPSHQRAGAGEAREEELSGFIPTQWLIGLFAGSLPPSVAPRVLDWALVHREKYAGFYLTLSLLELYSAALLTMNASKIRLWLEQVAANSTDWFLQLPVTPDSMSNAGESSSGNCKPLDWNSFVNGWIQSASALIRGTPSAFRVALTQTEDWALNFDSDGEKTDLKTAGHSTGEDYLVGDADLEEEEEPEEADEGFALEDNLQPLGTSQSKMPRFDSSGAPLKVTSPPTSASSSNVETVVTDEGTEKGKAGPTGGMMARFRDRLGLFAREGKGQGRRKVVSPHDAIMVRNSVQSICLWSDANEVVPCISTNQRRQGSRDTILQCFHKYSQSVPVNSMGGGLSSSVLGNYLLLSSDATFDTPFFFGIDCRLPAEKTLGLFPKAYSLDPNVIMDSDGITYLLQVLEPLVNSVHICLIGAGEDYLRWQYEQEHPSFRRKRERMEAAGRGKPPDPASLTQSIDEEKSRMNAVAMFFLKKSFPHISVLHGGFTAAVQYLYRIDLSINLAGALVDVDKPKMASLLGIPTSLPPRAPSSIVSRLEQAPAALASIGNIGTLITGLKPKSGSGSKTSLSTMSDQADGTPRGGSDTPSSSRSRSPLPAAPAEATTAKAIDSAATSKRSGENGGVSTDGVASGVGTSAEAAKQMFAGWGRRFSAISSTSLDSLKKGVANITVAAHNLGETAAAARQGKGVDNKTQTHSFEEVEDDGMGPRTIADTNSISITRTEKERAQALALHKISGLSKGERIVINRTELPGAVLFPAIKTKEVWVDAPLLESPELLTGEESKIETAEKKNETVEPETKVVDGVKKVKQYLQVHRYLVVSRERFIVLDSNGEGVGSPATVKSNRHLTELAKMTFRKRDPELVTLFFISAKSPENNGLKQRQYRVSKRVEFVQALQRNMERFK